MGKPSENKVIKTATRDFLEKNKSAISNMNNEEIENELVSYVNAEILVNNAVREKGEKIQYLHQMSAWMAAEVLRATHTFRLVKFAGSKLLCVYQVPKDDLDSNGGIYAEVDNDKLIEISKGLHNPDNKFLSELHNSLVQDAMAADITRDRDLIPVCNGIFDYKNKRLLPFDPKYVFLSKSPVRYVDNPVLNSYPLKDGSLWDVKSWFGSLSKDAEIVDLLYKVVGAAIRPNQVWNKTVFLYSESGNNGKGTLLALVKGIIGEDNYATLSVAETSTAHNRFALESIVGKSAILCDENSVEVLNEDLKNFKCMVTGDVIEVNRKFLRSIKMVFHGLIVQCFNAFPKTRDRSGSWYRRLLFVPFDFDFGKLGVMDDKIKTDYLKRQDVLEWVLWYVLTQIPDYYELPEPEACKEALNEYQNFNSSVAQFWDEFLDQFAWTLLPIGFAYALYVSWLHMANSSCKPVSRNSFRAESENVLAAHQWEYHDKNHKVRPAGRMDVAEPLILEYKLVDWMNTGYNGHLIEKICMPTLKPSYIGFTPVGAPLLDQCNGAAGTNVTAFPQPQAQNDFNPATAFKM